MIENRTWIPPRAMIGQRFAVHAGKSIDHAIIEELLGRGETEHPLWRTQSAILGVATIARYTDEREISARALKRELGEQRRWYGGPIGFVLTNVRTLRTPVPCAGKLGFWNLTLALERAVNKELV